MYTSIGVRWNFMDPLGVHGGDAVVGWSPESPDEEQLHAKLSHSIETVTGLRAEVRLVAPRTLQRSEGKAKRVIDKRKM